MVNQEKVRLMTQAEWFRQKEQRGALRINRYGKGSYVSLQIVKALIFCTAAAGVTLLMWAVFKAEELFGIYDVNEFWLLGRWIVIMYAAAMVVVTIVSGIVYARRYAKARGSVRRYFLILRKINHINELAKRRQSGEPQPAKKEVKRK